MNIKLSDLWRWDGTVDRGPYILIGVAGFAIKHNIDRVVASAFFDRSWSPFNYLSPKEAVSVTELPEQDVTFFATLLLLALPFIWTGVVLTLRRLRAVGLPRWWVVLFFAPLLNLLFFIVLSILPSKDAAPEPSAAGGDATGNQASVQEPGGQVAFGRVTRSVLDRVIPKHWLGSAFMGFAVTMTLAIGLTLLAVFAFGNYGWSLFVGVPFSMGLGSVLLDSYHEPRSLSRSVVVATLSVVFLGLGLFALAIEGVICLMMAAPLALLLAAIGGLLGWAIQRRPAENKTSVGAVLICLMLALPALMGAETADDTEPPLIPVVTALEMDAPPTAVWQNVIAFSELPEPDNPLFDLGVAYPMRAEIKGRGVGAVRHCVFSTGPFVEPITVWDEPTRLKFTVTSQPPAMHELSPWPNINAPHIDNYLISEGGQFHLVPLDGGARTRVEATTWYRHRIWPYTYWRVWSDLILHDIHLRVLRHIRTLSEAPEQHAAAPAYHP